MNIREFATEVRRRMQAETGVSPPYRSTEMILTKYAEIARELLLTGEPVRLPKIGTIKVVMHSGQKGYFNSKLGVHIPARPRNLCLKFLTTWSMREDLIMASKREDILEKYAVNTTGQQADGEKLGGKPPKFCPICSKPVVKEQGQIRCPEHGTEPFER